MNDYPECFECKGSSHPIIRNYFGQKYCSRCYPYQFEIQECDSCGKVKRVPTFTIKKLCIKCERTGQCVRCNKKLKSADGKIGKITQYGLVCNSCFYYFKREEQCEICGSLSRYLSKHTKVSDELRICPKCSRLDHQNCSRCGRSRPVEILEANKPVCKRCHLIGNVDCTKCGELMPAGLGKTCRDCYYKDLYQYKVQLHKGCIHGKQVKKLYSQFAQWFFDYKDPFNAAMLISNKSQFFIKIDKNWESLPSYKLLVEVFGMRTINMNRLVVSWLIEHKGLKVDNKYKVNQTEYSYIEQQFKKLPANLFFQKILNNYYVYIVSKKIKPRSIRMAMTPAIAFLNLADGDEKGENLPSQDILENYLNKTPGQLSAITGFINYLNSRFNTNLSPVVDYDEVAKIKKKRLEAKIIELSKLSEFSENEKHQWIYICLQYFHELPVKQSYSYHQTFRQNPESKSFEVLVDKNRYFLPLPNSVQLINLRLNRSNAKRSK